MFRVAKPFNAFVIHNHTRLPELPVNYFGWSLPTWGKRWGGSALN